ncbi:MAG: SpoIIE family protein phosphatase [Spirochaetaceae bacterium]
MPPTNQSLLVSFLLLLLLVPITAISAQEPYFEEPRNAVPADARFPELISDGERLMVLYQEVRGEGENREILIRGRTTERGREFSDPFDVAGPFSVETERTPVIYNALARSNGELFVSVVASPQRTEIYRAAPGSTEFQRTARLETEVTNVAPRIYETSENSLILFVNQNVGITQAILYSLSTDGESWSSLERLEEDEDVGLTFLPSHARLGGRDFVVFQGLNLDLRGTYQLYMKWSDDGGRSWSEAQRLTTFTDITQTDNPDSYDNQRPHLRPVGSETLGLTWERRYQGGNRQIYYAEYDREGEAGNARDEVTSRIESANFPRVHSYDGETYLLWFTNPGGRSRVILARREGIQWERQTLSREGAEATFPVAELHRERLHLLWQEGAQQGSSLTYLEPDQRADPPRLAGVNFVAGRRNSEPRAVVRITDPVDASGILGYSYTWSRDPEAPVDREVDQLVPEREVTVTADEDGAWYLRVRARDFAGNWSEPNTIEYFLDNTPPSPVSFPRPPVDEDGYLVSNSFELRWEPPPEEDVAGYSTQISYVAEPRADVDEAEVEVPAMEATIDTSVPVVSRRNLDNGVWALTVAPVDTVGNVGEPETLLFRLNKYVPETLVFSVNVSQDRLGRYGLEILGRGFTANGTINEIVLDEDGEEPYDYRFSRGEEGFEVLGNRSIQGPVIERILTGEYRLGLRHPERGLYFAPERLAFQATGVIKFGDYTVRYAPSYEVAERGRYFLTGNDLAFWSIVITALAAIIFSSLRIAAITREGIVLRKEAQALITGETVDKKKEERARQLRVRGLSLRVKFAFFVVLLVISVVVLVAVFLGRSVLQRQERILTSGLRERVEVLVQGVSTSARQFLENPQDNIGELQALPNQSEAMPEARYVTITGLGPNGEDLNVVYGTNDPALRGDSPGEERSIDTEEFIGGISRLRDPLTDDVAALREDLNAEAAERAGEIPAQIEEINLQTQQLVQQAVAAGEEVDSEATEQLDQIRTELDNRARRILEEIAGETRSFPRFETEELDTVNTDYIFYRPILFIPPGAEAGFEEFYRGTVRIGISTQLILEEIANTRRELIITTSIIAVLAVVAGVLGALILATIVVNPIQRLVAGVETIRDTEDKAALKGHSIELRSRDELYVLADAVNSMTEGLVKAAEANKDLIVGKDTQKMFIPLAKGSDGRKLTTGSVENEHVEIYGYYEGAKGVSGDYFAYEPLQGGRYYAVIKCDVAGKGVPAALIMVQVATLFLDYFKGWTMERSGLKLEKLVSRINDLISEREFRGRFAAFTLGILDIQKGAFYLSNAGDNQIHIFEREKQAVGQYSLTETPAAGVFPSDMVPSGFPQELRVLKRGDIFLLFTDGVEEAQRILRDENFSVYTVTEEDVESGRVSKALQANVSNEEFSIARIHAITEAVQRGGTYRLVKELNPVEEELLFDFSSCEPTSENTVLALTSVEKMFRIYPDPGAGPDDRVEVDKKIDEFLRAHFKGYERYFHHPLPEDPQSEYRVFTHLREDEQYDDLTILAIRKK